MRLFRLASTDWQTAFGPKSPRPRWPYLMAGRLSVEMGPTWPQSPQICGSPLWIGNWRIVQSCGRRHSTPRSGLSDVFAYRAFRPTDWHNCFGLCGPNR